jgi:hypothetical protein
MTELILNVYFYDAKTLLTSVAGGWYWTHDSRK